MHTRILLLIAMLVLTVPMVQSAVIDGGGNYRREYVLQPGEQKMYISVGYPCKMGIKTADKKVILNSPITKLTGHYTAIVKDTGDILMENGFKYPIFKYIRTLEKWEVEAK